MNQKKKPGRPPKAGPKLVKVYGSVLPETRDLIDKAVAENGTREHRERSKWIADAIKEKLNRQKKANRKS